MARAITIVANTKAQAERMFRRMADGRKTNVYVGRPQKSLRSVSNVETTFSPGCGCDSETTEFEAEKEGGRSCFVIFAEFAN